MLAEDTCILYELELGYTCSSNVGTFVCLFAAHLKLNFSLRIFTTMPTLMFTHAHLLNLHVNMWLIM